MSDTLIKRISELAGCEPDRLAVAFKQDTLTYRELDIRIKKVASRLASLGVKRGDRVPFSAISKPEMVAIYLGIQYIGAIAIFLDKNATPDSSYFIYKDVDANILLTDKPMKGYEDKCNVYSLRKLYKEAVESIESDIAYVDPAEEDIAEMIYTSGTTGTAKGVMLSYKAVYNILTNTVNGIGIQKDYRVLIPLPLNHSYALRVLRALLYVGASAILQNGFTFAMEVENNQKLYNCNGIALVPASVETISKQMQDKFEDIMSRFSYIEVGAGSLSVEQRKRLTSQLPNVQIYNTWGSSESGGAIFLDVTEAVKDPARISSLGVPIDGVDIKTVDANGNDFVSSKDIPGRMVIRGNMQMSGYWNRDELTMTTLVDGWLYTSDMIYIENGYVYMLGRADDIINVGGEKVSPIEVENIAGQYEEISECACIGVEDPQNVLGFVPVLFVVPKNANYSEDNLKKYLMENMEKYKVPAYFVTLLSLPRNKMQKIDRKELKNIWNKADSQDAVELNDTMRTLLTRRSIRKFTDQEIDKSILEMILTAGYYAPSGHNMQTWRFTVIQNQEVIAKLKEATRVAATENKVNFYGFENPKVLILVSNDERNVNGCQDASCAAENMMLAAWSYGIGSTWLNPLKTLRNAEPVSTVLDELDVPKGHIVWSMIALGYPVAEGTLLKKKTDVIKWVY